MDSPTRCFVGDLSDPWVTAIASAVPQPRFDLHCAGDLPDVWPAEVQGARTIVLHRSILSQNDTERLRSLRSREGGAARVILCAGPNVRYHQLERCSTSVDVLLSEATAAEVIARHVPDALPRIRADDPRPVVAVVSTNGELAAMIAESCQAAGFETQDGDEAGAPKGSLVLWDVPILEEGWDGRLRRLAERHRVVALIGFPDRAVVAQAREAGAFACLELPCDPADLAFVLDRASAGVARATPGHEVPGEPLGIKFARNGSSVAGRKDDSYNRGGD